MPTISTRDVKIIRAVSTGLAIGTILLLAYEIGYATGYNAAPYGNVVSDFDFYYWLSRLRFGITIGLIVGAVGLWLNKTRGLLLSASGLVGVLAVYAWWYTQTKAYLANSEVTASTQLRDPYYRNLILHGATWWDAVTLALVLLILLWMSMVVLRTLKARAPRASNS